MKKKNVLISVVCSVFFIMCVGAGIILFPKVKEENIAYSTSIEDLFDGSVKYDMKKSTPFPLD